MKNLTILLTFIILSAKGYSSTITAAANGTWTNSSTWNSNTTPTSGDVVVIPAGIAVQITSNLNMGSTILFIQVYGSLQLLGGGAKLTIASSSTIYIYNGGQIIGANNPSETIKIGGNQVFNAGIQNLVTGPSYANSTTPGFIPFITLPVKFISFSVHLVGKDVSVKWSTAQEIGADKYEIERSFDGRNWSTIAYVLAAGNTNDVSNYSFIDKNVSVKLIYYRIKQTDTNGQFSFTEVETISASSAVGGGDISIAANSHRIILNFSTNIKSNVLVSIISLSGQIVEQQTISQPAGLMILNANTSLQGNYIVSITNGKEVKTAKQVIL